MIELKFIRFGIPSLDELFCPNSSVPNSGSKFWYESGIQLPSSRRVSGGGNSEEPEVTSLCIAGPSGTGKSIMAMHLASRYYADCAVGNKWEDGLRPTVIYVSTDLTYPRALDIWTSFYLHLPNGRKAPFSSEEVPNCLGLRSDDNGTDSLRRLRIDLSEHSIHDVEELAKAIESPYNLDSSNPCGEVVFLNLGEYTAGDDWSFVTKIVSLLRGNRRVGPCTTPHHLLIIDAVEGLEMMVGKTDAHGEERSRRSRIAQLLRIAVGRCHLALVLEQDEGPDLLPEEYVTDSVLRLRCDKRWNYSRRTLEIVKSRGHASIRGKHDYTIRSGQVADTSKVELVDDPIVEHAFGDVSKPQSYIQVFHSLHSLTRQVMNVCVEGGTVHDLGPAKLMTPKLPGILTKGNGLPRGKVTVLTGDEATNKGRFARAFLAGCFQKESENEFEVGVYITTNNLAREDALRLLALHDFEYVKRAPENLPVLKDSAKKRFIYRQLEIHNLTSSILFHIVRRSIDKAISIAGGDDGVGWWAPCASATRVRLVLDDWSVLRKTYPVVEESSVFLPFLIRYLETRGVTTLIVETRPGQPDKAFSSADGGYLRTLVSNHLFTWHVPFFGQDKVAISTFPSFSDLLPNVVAELRAPVRGERRRFLVDGNDQEAKVEPDERLWGDPHFELYRGLEDGRPEPVPLVIRLFAAAKGFSKFAESANSTLSRIFSPTGCDGVVLPILPNDYVGIRDSSFLHSGTRTDYTSVFTADEYWPVDEPAATDPVEPYLSQRSVIRGQQNSDRDPFGTFQPERQLAPEVDEYCKRKKDFFPVERIYGSEPQLEEESDAEWYRSYDEAGLVPYIWDFGFLLLRERAWRAAMNGEGDSAVKLPKQAIEKIVKAWNYSTSRWSDPILEDSVSESENGNPCSLGWRDFLQACTFVARVQSAHNQQRIVPFDCELLTTQTFVCLVMEVWLSEILNSDRKGERCVPKFSDVRLGVNVEESEARSIQGLLKEDQGWRDEFFRVWLLLGECVGVQQLTDSRFVLKPHESERHAVAERHWYSTASGLSSGEAGEAGEGFLRPGRLPGRYITRGDWFLAISNESRSIRLGERAIDLLSRRQSNLARLETGIGLPVRDILHDHAGANGSSARKQERYEYINTALETVDTSGFSRPLNYAELRELGAPFPSRSEIDEGKLKSEFYGKDLHWFWRSQVPSYDRMDQVLERWSALFLNSASRWCQGLHGCSTNGFVAYDSLCQREDSDGLPSSARDLLTGARKELNRMCDVMIDELSKRTR